MKIEVPKSARECSWDQHLWKGREGSRIGQWGVKPMIQSPPEVSAELQGVLKLDDPSELFLSWENKARPLYLFDLPSDASHSRKGHGLEQGNS